MARLETRCFTSLPKIFVVEDNETDTQSIKRKLQEVVYEVIHQTLIIQSVVFMNTILNVGDGMSAALMPKQTMGPAYFSTNSLARPMNVLEADNALKPIQQSIV